MNSLARHVMVGALLGLTGCGTLGDTFHVEGFLNKGEPPTAESFEQCLAREYYFATKQEIAVPDGDYFHASRYMRRSMAASAGERVTPWVASDWNVTDEAREELDAHREKLVAAIETGAAARPCDCARAQVYYDMWLEQENDNDLGSFEGPFFEGPVQKDHVSAESFRAKRWLTRCEEPKMAESKDYIIYFGFNKFNLTAEAMAVVTEVAGTVKEMPSAAVAVTGHADRSGKDDYNLRLSERRAESVAGALRSEGVDNVTTDAKGESEPAVPTADGVQEPLNRRATISVSH